MKNNFNQNNKGFTLVETMVAISVLMFAVLGPLSIASSGLINARIARDQVTAFYLAQEGLEFVRYTRDTNYLLNPASTDNKEWLKGLGDCYNRGCIIDTASYFDINSFDPSSAITSCVPECGPLYIDQQTGLYTYNTQDPLSPFTRTVKVSNVGEDNNEIRVEATVEWKTGVATKKVVLSENIRNLYGYE